MSPSQHDTQAVSDLQALLSKGRHGKLRLSQVIPWDENPRDHDPEQVRLLVKSIKGHGFIAPLLLQDGTNKMVAGHGRRLALLSIAAESGEDPEVPVVWADLDDQQAAAYAIVDNRLTDLSTWNMPLLKGILANLDDGAFDVELSGFTEDALGELFDPGKGGEGGLRGGVDPDAAPPAPAEPKSRMGDLYELGRHRLLVGDATKRADVDALMLGEKADLVLTDPPYGVAYESSAADLKAGGKASIQNDALVGEEFQAFLDAVFDNYSRASAKHAAFYVFYPSRFHIAFEVAMMKAKLETRAQIIWVKNAASFGFAQYKWKHEPILMAAKDGQTPLLYADAHETVFYSFKAGQSPVWEGDRSQTTVWQVSRETGYVHPTQKPVELLRIAILNSSRPRQIVLDFFGGSGSTLIACESAGRTCYTMELDPKFADVIVARWENATGKKATLHRKATA